MRRAFIITLALVFVASSFVSATVASARALASKNIGVDEDGSAAARRRRTTRRRPRQGRTVVRLASRETMSSSNTAPETTRISPLEVREIDATGLSGVFERSRTGADGARRPLLINFWATWCVPCREEFPDLVALDAEFRPRGLEFITISLDDAAERTTSVPAFLRQMRATAMPAYLLNTPEPETAINAVDPTWSGALPATFLFDRDGQIVYKHFGRITPAEVRDVIERTLNAGR